MIFTMRFIIKSLFPKKSRSIGFVINLRLFSFNLRQFILQFNPALGLGLHAKTVGRFTFNACQKRIVRFRR